MVADGEPLLRSDFVLVFLGHVLDGLILRLCEAFSCVAGAAGGVQGRLGLALERVLGPLAAPRDDYKKSASS